MIIMDLTWYTLLLSGYAEIHCKDFEWLNGSDLSHYICRLQIASLYQNNFERLDDTDNFHIIGPGLT